MPPRQRPKRAFDKIYSSVPRQVKEAIQEEADRRGLQLSDVIRELLIERYGQQAQKSVRGSS